MVSAPGAERVNERSPAVTGDSAVLAQQIDGYLASKFEPADRPRRGVRAGGRGRRPRPALPDRRDRRLGDQLRHLRPLADDPQPVRDGPGHRLPLVVGRHPAPPRRTSAVRSTSATGLLTIPAIQGRWAPHGASNDPTNLNCNWTRNVGIYYAELGGDPQGAVFTGRVVADAAAAPAATAGRGRLRAGRGPHPHPGPRQAPGKGAEAAQEALSQLGTPLGAAAGRPPRPASTPAASCAGSTAGTR